MGKSSPSPPAAPDPYATARAQTGSNVGTAIANSWLGNANEIGPLGSVNYTQTGSQQVPDGQGNNYDVPTFTRETTLSPEEQLKLQQSQGIQLGLLGLGADHLNQVQQALNPFDANYYLQQNPDVAADAKWTPMKDISQFNEQSYLAANPDVAAAIQGTPGNTGSPIQWGAQTYFNANPDVAQAYQQYLAGNDARGPDQFNGQAYLAANPDVAQAGVDPWEHWQQYGKQEGRTGGFAAPMSAEQFAAQHWNQYGQNEGRQGFFDEQAYLAANPDVAAAGADASQHYFDFGAQEGRGFGNTGATPGTPGMTALQHWQQFGQNEHRLGSGLEDPTAFAKQHWSQSGQAEGRDPSTKQLGENLPNAVGDISQYLPLLREFGLDIPQLSEADMSRLPDLQELGLPPGLMEYDPSQRQQMLEVGQNRPDLLEAGQRPDLLQVGQNRPDLLEAGAGPDLMEAEGRPDLLEYGTQDFSQQRQQVEDALWSRLNPQLERDRSALDVQLTNEGFTRGSEAYNRAMDEFTRQSNDARMQVVLAGSQEDSRLAGLRMQQIGTDNSARLGEYGAGLQGLQATNQARTSEYDQLLAQLGLTNSSRQGEYNNLLSQINADNTARQNEYGMSLQGIQATNAARQGEYGNLLSQTAADNQARQATHQQYLDQLNATNAARTGQFTMQGQAAQNNNAARLGEWTSYMQGQEANNAARQGNFTNQMGALQNDNAIRQANFGNQFQAAQFANTSRERALQEQLTLRQTPLNEASALLSGGQVNMPQFSPYQGGQVANTPLGDYVYRGYEGQNKAYQTEATAAAQQNAAMFGAGANLLGGLFKLSDRRLKRDYKKLGEISGIPFYVYRYNWDDKWEVGVMADEVERVLPHAVTELGGVKLVNYGAL
jgi:hypothetical protein